MTAIEQAVDRGWLPTPLLRLGIRAVCAARLRDETRGGPAATAARQRALLAELTAAPIAIATEAANAQHYEVAAARYPRARVVGLSNSHSQRAYITGVARERGLTNLTIVTGDINTIAAPGRFDRIVSVEMFEHVRNHRALFERIAGWLADDGRLFVHVFAHRALAYTYEDRGPSDWMAREFFTGGIMPSVALLPTVATPLRLDDAWRLDGTHYARTALAWLANLDRARAEAIEVLGGGALGRQRYHRWRVFFLACAELFGFRDGSEWLVAHYRFAPR
jgi:cyclopropane-fatty-acyl-phospholipid synthase